MNNPNKLLSDLIAYRTYAKYLPHLQRRESLEESINRNMVMNLDRFPKLSNDITKTYNLVHDLKIMPSMRALQFAGPAILKNNVRSYNCSYTPIDGVRKFSEILFVLLSGTGVGFSVQKRHINQLPKVGKPTQEGRFLVQDSIQGWAQALDILMNAYFYSTIRPVFDFSNISAKGTLLATTGARAPGPEPLKQMLIVVEEKLKLAVGRKLESLEVHDIVCILSDCVLAGGIRRAALISLFDRDDKKMLTCKSGTWWEKHPYRARANNSAMLPRNEVTKEEFLHIFDVCQKSKAGEPGLYWTNSLDWGTNPSLRAGTKVFTTNGIIDIEKLENKKFNVKNINGDISPAICWLSGKNIQLYEIELENGKKYWATPEHKWPVKLNNRYVKLETAQLKVGDEFPVLKQDKLFDGTKGNYRDGFVIGWLYGDGWITERKDNGKKQFGWIISKKDRESGIDLIILNYLENITGNKHNGSERDGNIEINSSSEKLMEHFDSFGVKNKQFGIPSSLWVGGSEELRKGFIDGLFSSDGSIEIRPNKYMARICLISSKSKLMDDVFDLLGFYGITSRLSRTSVTATFPNGKNYNKKYERYSLRIGNCDDIEHFKKIFKLSIGYKQERLMQSKGKYKLKYRNSIKIKNIKLSDIKEDVWDISVRDETHCFQISHCITGNCVEIGMNPDQFCNLSTINQTGITSKKDFLRRVYGATLLGTLQATYTDFPYLSQNWKRQTEEEALLGVSFTGIADSPNVITSEWLIEGAKLVLEVNEKYAKKIGINLAARTTALKPEGSSSCVLMSSSGIHARHSKYYIRRFQISKNDALYWHLMVHMPDLVEDYRMAPNTALVSIPQVSPEGSLLRENETAESLFSRAMMYNKNWVRNGYRSGVNHHNVSCTVSVKDDEWDNLGQSMWKNRENYAGISLLPWDLGDYDQTPFESCTKEKYEEMSKFVKDINFTDIIEEENNTNMLEQLACSGGACEVISLK